MVTAGAQGVVGVVQRIEDLIVVAPQQTSVAMQPCVNGRYAYLQIGHDPTAQVKCGIFSFPLFFLSHS